MQQIPGYENYYSITEYGILYSHDRYVMHPSGSKRLLRGRQYTAGLRPDGYLEYTLCKDGIRATILVHRLVYIAFYGKLKDGMHIAHIDGDKLNNHMSNLTQVTPAENNGMKARHTAAKLGLSNKDIQTIRNLHPTFHSQVIAIDYGIPNALVLQLVDTKNYDTRPNLLGELA